MIPGITGSGGCFGVLPIRMRENNNKQQQVLVATSE